MNGLLCAEQKVFIQAAVRDVGATVLELMDRIVEVDLGKERGTTVLWKRTSNIMINIVLYAQPMIEARYRYLPNTDTCHYQSVVILFRLFHKVLIKEIVHNSSWRARRDGTRFESCGVTCTVSFTGVAAEFFPLLFPHQRTTM